MKKILFPIVVVALAACTSKAVAEDLDYQQLGIKVTESLPKSPNSNEWEFVYSIKVGNRVIDTWYLERHRKGRLVLAREIEYRHNDKKWYDAGISKLINCKTMEWMFVDEDDTHPLKYFPIKTGTNGIEVFKWACR